MYVSFVSHPCLFFCVRFLSCVPALVEWWQNINKAHSGYHILGTRQKCLKAQSFHEFPPKLRFVLSFGKPPHPRTQAIAGLLPQHHVLQQQHRCIHHTCTRSWSLVWSLSFTDQFVYDLIPHCSSSAKHYCLLACSTIDGSWPGIISN